MFDFNADVGEGYHNEEMLSQYVSSFNISCGAHAGDFTDIKRVIKIALDNQIVIGAHPSYPDRKNFGRVATLISKEELKKNLLEQLANLSTLVETHGGKLSYIKPHGALYHKVSTDQTIANLLIDVSLEHSENLKIMGLPNSVIQSECKARGVKFIREAFADRLYNDDLSLVSRSTDKAVLTQPSTVLKQVQNIIHKQTITSVSGACHKLEVDTICFHGDTANAIQLVKYCYLHLND